MVMNTRRRLDQLTRRMSIVSQSAAAEKSAGGRCHDNPAHVAQVLQCLADCGAVDELERIMAAAGLTPDDLAEDELSPIGALPPKSQRR